VCGKATLPFWATALPGIALAAVLALDPNAAKTRASRDDKSDKLTCGDDKPDKGGMLFKAGTKEKQHSVAIHRGSQFSQKANHSAAGLSLDAVGVIVVLPEP
jgi:hypothetical protein